VRWARRLAQAAWGLVLPLLLLGAVGLGMFSAYEGWVLLHPPAATVVGDPGTAASLDYRCLPVTPPVVCSGEMLFTARGHVPLAGWIVPSYNSTYPGLSAQWSTDTVILVQDHGQSRTDGALPIWAVTRLLVLSGYNVVLFDTRGTGQSGGAGIGFGTIEAEDVLAVVDYLPQLIAPQGHVAVWGLGTGADAAILAAARSPRIGAVIADSPYASPEAYLRRAVPRWTGLPALPFAYTVPWAMQRESGVRWAAYDPLRAVAKLGGPAPRPLLLVGVDRDPLVPWSDVERLARAAGDARAYPLEVFGAGHLEALVRSRPAPGAGQLGLNEYLCDVLNTLAAMQTGDIAARPNRSLTGPCGGVRAGTVAEAGLPPALAGGNSVGPGPREGQGRGAAGTGA
jgi:pimeloyl-ACP methyl ester carboxylesterase